ncbi:hypothetical protein R0J90_17155, partial [Micrococcus sp. SIMBA_144]
QQAFDDLGRNIVSVDQQRQGLVLLNSHHGSPNIPVFLSGSETGILSMAVTITGPIDPAVPWACS